MTPCLVTRDGIPGDELRNPCCRLSLPAVLKSLLDGISLQHRPQVFAQNHLAIIAAHACHAPERVPGTDNTADTNLLTNLNQPLPTLTNPQPSPTYQPTYLHHPSPTNLPTLTIRNQRLLMGGLQLGHADAKQLRTSLGDDGCGEPRSTPTTRRWAATRWWNIRGSLWPTMAGSVYSHGN